MSRQSRREFLEDSMFAAAAAVAAGSASQLLADEKPQNVSPSEKLSVAVVGVRGRGGSHIGAFAGRGETEVTYVCDVDERVGMDRVAQIEKKQGRAPKFVKDMREIFDDKSVDIVTTATPNHWHALCSIWAMQAGKDVYVEKPVSHNVSEGRRMVEAARKYKRICQTGTQSRSMPGMREAIAYLHEGKLGTVSLGRGLCYKRRGSIGPKGEYPVPEHIDYDLWCGPAPMGPVTRPQFHYDWHWQWDFGNGDLGNQGIHQVDIARWGLGLDSLASGVVSYGGRFGYEDAGETANTQVCLYDYGDKTMVFEVRGLNTDAYKGAKVGVIWEGSEGYMVAPSYHSASVFDKNGNMIKSFSGGSDGNHFTNFLKAVRSRKVEELNADILDGHLSSAMCHLANISYRLGSQASAAETLERLAGIKTNDDVKETFERTKQHLADNKVDLEATKLQLGAWLKLDPKAETFVDNSQADAMLTRDYRAPYVVPGAGQV